LLIGGNIFTQTVFTGPFLPGPFYPDRYYRLPLFQLMVTVYSIGNFN